jgi:hypothetical protein
MHKSKNVYSAGCGWVKRASNCNKNKIERSRSYSAEIPLFWATHKGKQWIRTSEELGRSNSNKFSELVDY